MPKNASSIATHPHRYRPRWVVPTTNSWLIMGCNDLRDFMSRLGFASVLDKLICTPSGFICPVVGRDQSAITRQHCALAGSDPGAYPGTGADANLDAELLEQKPSE
ncbi:unnamed protein product [Phytophthora fragariaefolia]|uniref:Unnamed protein product n=1 Tax=Phytophthora fragariaefolia TaxID=1490495 RepID=A0A9W6U7A3_9STRA|nr:unnamed protein product [Phytophthora fragariaefolia]